MTGAAADGCVRVSDDDRIRRITLDRPGKANALTTPMMRAVAGAIASASRDGVRMIVLSGNGARGFCAGADLGELAGGPAQHRAQAEALLKLTASFADAPVPVVSLVHANCLGAGVMLACLSCVVIAAADAAIGFPEMQFGMFPAMVHAVLLERVAAPLAYQLCIGSGRLSAAEARQIGIVTDVLAAEQFAEKSRERCGFYADRLAALACARRADRREAVMPVVERVRRARALIEENLAAPEVHVLLESALRRGRRA